MKIIDYYEEPDISEKRRAKIFLTLGLFIAMCGVFGYFIISRINPGFDEVSYFEAFSFGRYLITVFALLSLLLIIFRIAIYFSVDDDVDKRKEYLEKHSREMSLHHYKYSIITTNNKEILCDEFEAKNDGTICPLSDKNDSVWNDAQEFKYHKIIDNTDSHTLNVQEIKE